MTTTGTDRHADLTDIQSLIDDVALGINTRDIDRCLARVAPDAVFVVANGARAHGSDAIRDAHVRAFAAGSAPRGDARFVVLDAAFPTGDLAVITTGAYRAAPEDALDLARPPMVVVWVLTRGADGWQVVSRQFTPVT